MVPTANELRLAPPSSDLAALRYLLYRPEAAPGNGGERRPLLLFLHGAGERGDGLERVKLQGLPRLLGEGLELPAFVLAPQCPGGRWWPEPGLVGALGALLDEAERALPVDPERLLVTGISMGGFGTWALALAQPRRFAALAPVCGGGEPGRACEIAHVPQWVFHGGRDDVVPVEYSEEMVRALERCGAADLRFTVYPELAHNSWDAAYGEEELFRWLLAQRRPG